MTQSVPPPLESWLRAALNLGADEKPFAWQLALFDRLKKGDVVSTLDIPTGLGKTSVMALWLVARAAGASLPRRLVYVVDRRAVVDQATDVADHLKKVVDGDGQLAAALGLSDGLPVSTLRGQHVDNRRWLEDPSSTAIIVGTVDMIGSRLLFEGYGVSRKMRPYHAGLLGADTLLVLDEAHLVPPFGKLLETIAQQSRALGPIEEEHRAVLPAFRFMSLSATMRPAAGEVFGLTEGDRKPGTITRKRLDASKRLRLIPHREKDPLAPALAQQAWDLCSQGERPLRCLIFCNERKVAQDAQLELEKLAKAGKRENVQTELFVGGRRVFERQAAAERLAQLGLIAGRKGAPEALTFVFATSAAEVGVDLDADEMVCDLVAWERMVQRLGRVNRRGEREARVSVLRVKAKDEELEARLDATARVLSELPRVGAEEVNASPGAITALKQRASEDNALQELLTAASTPAPLHPPLTRALLEAWSMTSLEVHTGRPEVEPWLRGWDVNAEPQTTIVWRDLLPIDSDGALLGKSMRQEFLAAAPPQVIESLETETRHVVAWLKERLEATQRAQKGAEVPIGSRSSVAIVIGKDDSARAIPLGYVDDDKRFPLERLLSGATLLVDSRLGGLSHGLLAADSNDAPDVSTLVGDARVPFRISRTRDAELLDAAEQERRELALPIRFNAAQEPEEWLVVDSIGTDQAETEDGRSVSPNREQSLVEHSDWTEQAARCIARRLSLTPRYAELLATAARLHDEGKRAKRWQRAFRARGDKAPYAKTRWRPNLDILGGYRHELGSLPYAECHERFLALNEQERDLCLHLIAAHHGRARPTIPVDGAEEPPSKLEERAQQIALRFARLEKAWGPWGLAWWEALLRAADQQASRRNDQEGKPRG